ncbi:MAG: disulfide bond formation protein B [Pseudomonadota bacterium]
MSGRLTAAVAGLGSAGLLLGALAFQYLGGLPPCALCIWQRWPHGIAIVLALGALALPSVRRPLAIAAALAVAAGAAIALYHTGVEQLWWPGPDTCSAPDISNLTAEELLDRLMTTPVVRCDEVLWSFAGLSMASWNGVLSLALMALWLVAAARQASSSASQ